jgi:hypothetical protein
MKRIRFAIVGLLMLRACTATNYGDKPGSERLHYCETFGGKIEEISRAVTECMKGRRQ